MTIELNLVPLQGSSTVNSRYPYGGEDETPPNNPPVSQPLPSLSARIDVPYSFDASPYFHDPDGDPLTYSWQNEPAGLTGNSDGTLTGTPTVSGTIDDLSVTANDGKGGTATEVTTISITEPVQTGYPRCWPAHSVTFNSSAERESAHVTSHPSQRIAQYRSAYRVIQGITGVATNSGRRDKQAALRHLKEYGLPGVITAAHLNIQQMEDLRAPNTTSERRIRYDAVIASRGEYVLQSTANDPLGRGVGASAQQAKLMMNMANPDYNQYWVDRWYAWLNDPDPEANLVEHVDHVFHDNFGVWPNRAYGTALHISPVKGITNNRADVRLTNWSGLPLDGNPDSDGFERVTKNYILILYAGGKPPNLTNLSGCEKGFRAKRDGGDMILRVNDPLEPKVSTSWTCQISAKGGTTRCADWLNNGSQLCPNYSNPPGGEMEVRTNGYWDWFARVDAKRSEILQAAGKPAKTYGRHANFISGSYLSWVSNTWDMSVNPYLEQWDAVQCEHADYGRNETNSFRAKGQSGYRYGLVQQRDLKWYVGRLHFGETCLRKDAFTDLGFRYLMHSVSTADDENPNAISNLAAAFLQSWHVFVAMGGWGWWAHNPLHGASAGRYQCQTEMFNWSPGGAPISPAVHNFGTITDLSSNDWQNVIELRANDWGGRSWGQWEAWWPNGEISILNFGQAGSVIDNWVPFNHPGGIATTAADEYTIHGLQVGEGLWTRNWETYINPEDGENINEGIWALTDENNRRPTLGRDPYTYPNVEGPSPGLGEYLGTNGDTITCGLGSSRVMAIGPIP